ncbi:dienelactone hydrolase [Xylogone sp. PMI_703]|nr:dienelactone hydrolase [Xylogone sp. PMI_703]
MASKPPAKCCTVGVKHEGIPAGYMIKITGGHDAYLATPPLDKKHKDVGILYIPDVLGIYQNSQLIADQLAANGYTTVVPDLFKGDQLELNIFDGDQLDTSIDPTHPGDFDLLGWLQAGRNDAGPHTSPHVDPIIVDSIQYMKEMLGVKRIGSVGYCFGAKYVVRHYKNGIDVGYIAHPSFVEEEELSAILGPLCISAAETDPIFPAESRHRSEEILRETGQAYQISLFSGVLHGFAVRGETTLRVQKFAKEQAFLHAINWFNTWLI